MYISDYVRKYQQYMAEQATPEEKEVAVKCQKRYLERSAMGGAAAAVLMSAVAAYIRPGTLKSIALVVPSTLLGAGAAALTATEPCLRDFSRLQNSRLGEQVNTALVEWGGFPKEESPISLADAPETTSRPRGKEL
eukprot:GILJ01004798.1.p1 GENE.GILJ01004798.1~~GILJ01004798.1.p1  ORF type:complete len:136 (-),score=15.92 GILJ01004798.1:104-511(-)